MKKLWMILLVGCLFMFPAMAHAQLDKFLDGLLGVKEQSINPKDLKVLRLEFSPDPVREGQRLVFQAIVSNNSGNAGRVTIAVRDKDRVISEITNAVLKPGENQVVFPETSYRFSRSNYCFTVEADVDKTRTPIDVEKEFCAQKAHSGWTMSDKGIVSLRVEDFEMYPDPASPGQEIRFMVKLRNDGRPIRGHIQIQDRDQVVAKIENAIIPNGSTEYQFPRSQYTFQRLDICFTVSVDFEQTLYPAAAPKNKYCASPVGWTLKPGTKWQRGERGK